MKDMLQDVVALSDHATYLSNKTNFLLDATLGLINLEQNQIIKIFSIAAVVDAADADRFVLRNELQAHAGVGMAFRLSVCAGADADHRYHSVCVVQAQGLAVMRLVAHETSAIVP